MLSPTTGGLVAVLARIYMGFDEDIVKFVDSTRAIGVDSVALVTLPLSFTSCEGLGMLSVLEVWL